MTLDQIKQAIGVEPYYEEDAGVIYNADCLDIMKKMPDKCVDLVVTDPPYGIGKAEWDVSFPTQWIEYAFNVSDKILCMSGNSSLMIAGHAFGYHYKDCIVMNATNGMTRSKVAFGNWFPVIVAGNWKFEGRPNLIRFTVDGVRNVRSHPSPKPLNAMLPLLKWYSKENDVICDCYLGSGTTAVAAKQLGRKYIGIEISEQYCKIAVERLSQGVLAV